MNEREKRYKLTHIMTSFPEGLDNLEISSRKLFKLAGYMIGNHVTVEQWNPASEPPETDGTYICRYIFGDHYDRPFMQILDYYATDKNPHFQHEGVNGMKVTHWMPVPHDPMEKGL